MTKRTLIKAPRLFDGVASKTVNNAYVVVENGTIVDTGDASALGDDAASQFAHTVVLGDDTTLLPGLINMHTHLSFSAEPTIFDDALAESDATKMIRIVDNMRTALECGMTTLRDCGTWPRLAMPARDAVESGLMVGPRLVTSGAITTTGGHCWFCASEADSADEVRKAVRSHVKDGVDFIKLFATGGNTTPGSNALVAQYTLEQMCAATEEARKAGRRTASHAHAIEGVRNSIKARVTTIEHCSFQSPETGIGWDDDMVNEMLEAGTYVCPTIFRGVAKFESCPNYHFSERELMFVGRRRERHALAARLFEAGIPLVSGNDAGVSNCHIRDYPGDLIDTVEGSGLSPAAVLHSATSVAAAALGREELGVIAAGKAADLLAVRGDVVADIHAIARPVMIMARGNVVHGGGEKN